MTFPRLRLRDEVATLLDLPWEQPLAEWGGDGASFRELPVGPSRHLVRFMVSDGIVYALKELPAAVAAREYEVLRHLEDASLPGVRAVGLAERPQRGDAILLTEYLRHSMQYRRLLMRLREITPAYRDRLLDAMALLLVDLHRGGVYWGDCSLSNTLFRRDGDRIQAYLVDAETSEVHPGLSDGQRRFDLDILVENVAFGFADLAAYQGRTEDIDAAIESAESVRGRYQAFLEFYEKHAIAPEEAADRWLREVYRPTLARITAFVAPDRDLVQAYCDVLEHKWLLSERAGYDVGLDTAIESYVAEGAPAPEQPRGGGVDGALERLDVEEDDPGLLEGPIS
jgi:hypothetical protein